MPEQNVTRLNFNRGRVSPLALARTDIERVEFSAETQTNWVPRTLGSMMLRPGTEYIGSTRSDLLAYNIPFVKSTDDTAILEFTEGALQVRENETFVTRPSVTTAIRDDQFTNADSIQNGSFASSAPSEAQLCCAFSADGTLAASGQVNSPYVRFWSVSGTVLTPLSNPASLPTGQVNGVAFSTDGSMLALALNVSPYVEFYSISGTTFTKLAGPGVGDRPTGVGNGVCFGPSGTGAPQRVVVAHATSPFITIYSISGTTFTKLANPASLPAGTGRSVSFMTSQNRFTVAHDTTPFISTYIATPPTLTSYVKQADPASLPAGNATGVSYNNDATVLAVSHATTPFVTLYTVGTTDFTHTKIATSPTTLPDGNGQCIAFSPDSMRLAAGHATTQFMTLYQYDPEQTSRLTKLTDPGTLPSDSVDGIAISPYNLMLCATTTSPYLNIYSLPAWQDYDQSGADSQILSSIYLIELGTDYNEARRQQGVYVPAASRSIEHAIEIRALIGPVTIRVGSTLADDNLITEKTLETGYHSLKFTPTGSFFYIRLSNNRQFYNIIDYCKIAASGTMSLTHSIVEADLDKIRYDQSGDVIYIATDGYAPLKVQHWGAGSWSLVSYQPEDGPFRPLNSTRITITPSALSGNGVTLTASRPLFKSGHVGALWKLTSIGQQTSDSFTGANQFSANNIKVTGVGTGRNLSITRSGTWVATITLQRSIGEPGSWVDVATFTTNATSVYNDALDNQIVYYRIGIKTGNYTSGTAVVAMDYAAGGLDGIGRITQFLTSTSVLCNVLKPFGSTVATEAWKEGAWSTVRGYPSAVALHEGRLWWAGHDKVWGSESDAYENFDEATVGDAGPISRSIGAGPVDTINFLLALQRMVLGTEGAELSAKSNSFDEPLTPTNFNLKPFSTHGSTAVGPVKIDNNGAFVHRNSERLMQLAWDVDTYDYETSDLTRLIPEICRGGIRRIGVQRLPDTRIHCVKNDGTVALMVFDHIEQVYCWVDIETDGDIEDVVVLPNTPEDDVYYVVKRTINSATKRYLEKWAYETECQGDVLNKQLDAFITYTGVSTATLTGLSHLEGETVGVWGNSTNLGTYTVTAGQITVSEAVTNAVIGLPYTATYKSTKLAYAAANGTALTKTKRVRQLGLILYKTYHYGLEVGADTAHVTNLPSEHEGQFLATNYLHDTADMDMFAISDTWNTDSRLVLKATAPMPVTVLAATISIETNG